MKLKSTAFAVCLLSTVFLCFLPAAYAAPGDLDTTFSLDGKSFEPVGTGGSDVIRGTALQSNGKIVVAGIYYNGSNNDFAVIRLNSDGSPDTSFDGDGQVITPVLSGGDMPYSVAF